MGAKSNGPRHRSRSKLKKKARAKGMPSIGKLLQKFKPGERVVVKVEPSVQKGMPALRFIGKAGTIIKSRGRAYVMKIKDGNKEKTLITHPVHIKSVGK